MFSSRHESESGSVSSQESDGGFPTPRYPTGHLAYNALITHPPALTAPLLMSLSHWEGSEPQWRHRNQPISSKFQVLALVQLCPHVQVLLSAGIKCNCSSVWTSRVVRNRTETVDYYVLTHKGPSLLFVNSPLCLTSLSKWDPCYWFKSKNIGRCGVCVSEVMIHGWWSLKRTVGYKDKEHFLVLGSVTELVYCCRSQDTFWVLVLFVVVFACALMLQPLVVF